MRVYLIVPVILSFVLLQRKVIQVSTCILNIKVEKKCNIFVGYPPSVQDFFAICITYAFKRTSLRLFRFKISQ